MLTEEKKRCQYELAVENFFGLPTSVKENTVIKIDFGMLVSLLATFDAEKDLRSSALVEALRKIKAWDNQDNAIIKHIVSLATEALKQYQEK